MKFKVWIFSVFWYLSEIKKNILFIFYIIIFIYLFFLLNILKILT